MLRPRERLQKAIKRQQPDRVPLDMGGTATCIEYLPYLELLRYLGLDGKETSCFVRDHAEPHEEVLHKLSIDTRYVRINPPKCFTREIFSDNSYYDEWGIRWRKPTSSYYWDPVEYPFSENATVLSINQYSWPNVKDNSRIEGLREKARSLYETTSYALVADAPLNGVFETCLLLRGYQAFLEDLIMNKHFAYSLLEKVTELLIDLYNHYLEAVGDYVEVIMTTDDLGTQQSLLLSPAMYRNMIKPFQKELYDAIKKKTKASLFLHSCGAIRPLFPDLIEIGVDIINPVQPMAANMDTSALKVEYGKDITFWGAVDTQRVLDKGSPEDVADEVRRRIEDLSLGVVTFFALRIIFNQASGRKTFLLFTRLLLSTGNTDVIAGNHILLITGVLNACYEPKVYGQSLIISKKQFQLELLCGIMEYIMTTARRSGRYYLSYFGLMFFMRVRNTKHFLRNAISKQAGFELWLKERVTRLKPCFATLK